MIKLVCWNTAYRRKSWCCLRDMDVDVALVQEACNPPQDVLSAVDTGPREHWDPTTWNSDWWVGRWRHLTDRKTMIVKRSDTVRVEWFKQVAPISCVAKDEIGVSGIGTIAAARVIPPNGESFVAVSMYARWIAASPDYPQQVEGRLFGRVSAPNHIGPVRVYRQCRSFDTPDIGGRRSQSDLRITRERSAGAGGARKRSVREVQDDRA